MFKPPPVKTKYKKCTALTRAVHFFISFTVRNARWDALLNFSFEIARGDSACITVPACAPARIAAERYFLNAVRRIEFSTTNTELNAIAAAAIIGFSRPATATGIAAEL